MNAISLNRVLNTRPLAASGTPRSESIHSQKRLESAAESRVESTQVSPVRDTVEISAAGKAKSQQIHQDKHQHKSEESSAKNPSQLSELSDLSAEEKAQVQELQKTDRATRAHEQAHLGASGGLARGGASFSFTKGPDGQLYAVSGEVSIDTSPVPGNPDATIRKADTIRRAALAPSEPSSQDKAVAAQAAKMANQARAELLKNKDNNSIYNTDTDTDNSDNTDNKQNSISASDNIQDSISANISKKFNPVDAIGELLNLIA